MAELALMWLLTNRKLLFSDNVQFNIFGIDIFDERFASWILPLWFICDRWSDCVICGWRYGASYWCYIQHNGKLKTHFFPTNVQTTFLVACIIYIATLSFVTFIFISEWKRCWTIADCTVTRFGHLWFRLCSRHSNGYVCNYESVVCSSWCRFIGVVSLWIWSGSTWLCWCLLSLWWSKTIAAISSYWKSLFVKWNRIFNYVCRYFPNTPLLIVETTNFKLNLILTTHSVALNLNWKLKEIENWSKFELNSIKITYQVEFKTETKYWEYLIRDDKRF